MSKAPCRSTLDLMLTRALMDLDLVLQVQGEVHHDRRLHVLMLREEEMQWEQGHSKPRYHMRWNSSLGEAAASPTDSAGSMHAEYMNLPDADSDQLSHFRWLQYALLLLHCTCSYPLLLRVGSQICSLCSQGLFLSCAVPHLCLCLIAAPLLTLFWHVSGLFLSCAVPHLCLCLIAAPLVMLFWHVFCCLR